MRIFISSHQQHEHDSEGTQRTKLQLHSAGERLKLHLWGF